MYDFSTSTPTKRIAYLLKFVSQLRDYALNGCHYQGHQYRERFALIREALTEAKEIRLNQEHVTVTQVYNVAEVAGEKVTLLAEAITSLCTSFQAAASSKWEHERVTTRARLAYENPAAVGVLALRFI